MWRLALVGLVPDLLWLLGIVLLLASHVRSTGAAWWQEEEDKVCTSSND